MHVRIMPLPLRKIRNGKYRETDISIDNQTVIVLYSCLRAGVLITEVMMSDDKNLRAMRNMAWQRAKGEIRSMYETYYDRDGSFERFRDKAEDFFKDVEDNGLQE